MEKQNLPYVTISYAQSLDGRIATSTGDSQWIGGPESLRFAHELRRDHQGILVGVGTILRDNPQLTCRIPHGKNPIRIVLDTRLRTPESSKIVTTLEQAPVWLLHGTDFDSLRRNNLEDMGCRCISLVHENAQGTVGILKWLGQQGVASIFVEGGGATITSFLVAGVVDRLAVVTAPLVIGKGVEAIGDLGVMILSQAMKPLRWSRWNLGDDEVTDLFFTNRKFPG